MMLGMGGLRDDDAVGGGGGDPPSDRVVRREVIHRGRKFDFENVYVRPGPAGGEGEPVRREMVRHPGAVCVLPVLEEAGERRVVLIRNHRFTVDRVLWEVPAGGLEAGEAPEECAGRELEEETGYAAGEIRRIGAFLTSPGITDEMMHAFVATDLRYVGQRLEADEAITVRVVGAEEAVELAMSGEMEDGKSVAVVLMASRLGVI